MQIQKMSTHQNVFLSAQEGKSKSLSAMASLAEAVGRFALYCLSQIVVCLACTDALQIKSFSQKQKEQGTQAWKAFLSFFQTAPQVPSSHPLTAAERENRIRKGTDNIERRLNTEWKAAQNQMNSELKKPFRYIEYSYANAPDIRVGNLEVADYHYIGRRPEMEDESLAVSFNLHIGGKDYPVQLFGVFDGHGGKQVSSYLKTHFQEKLTQTILEFNANGLSSAGIWNALKMTTVRLDQDFQREFPHLGTPGSTAAVAMLLDNQLWCANVGDSRIAMNCNGTPYQLTEDAKPDDPKYKKGIEHRNGMVFGGRINGILAVGRAIGDHSLNGAASGRCKITRVPFEIPPGSVMVLGCDGIWDVASTKQVVAAIQEHQNDSLNCIAKNIVYSAYSSGSMDNLTCMLVRF